MSERYYTASNEWVRFYDRFAEVGLTGKGLTGDIVYIDLPQIGQRVKKGESVASVEAVKSVVEVHAPVGGKVCAANDTVLDDPDVIAKQPEETWLFRIKCEEQPDKKGLLAKSEYEQL